MGKTTTAYEIVKNYSEFRRVSELDIIRTIVRTAVERFSTSGYLNKEDMLAEYEVLFESLSNSNLEIAKKQSQQLIPYIKEIVLRQQRRKIPTILEGAGIIPSTYFPNDQPLDWLTSNVIFINLYLSDKNEHITRRTVRSSEREYMDSESEARKVISKIRDNKNEILHNEAIKLGQTHYNVLSIDTANKSPKCVAETIMNLVKAYYASLS